jgi:hypothetical protein
MTKPNFFTKSLHRSTLDGPINGAPRMKVPFKPTRDKPLILSTSEFGDFLRCRLRWNWRYRLGLESRKIAVPRSVGIIVHAGNEAWYALPLRKRTARSMEKLVKAVLRCKEARALSSKDRDLTRAMLIGYAEWASGDHDESDSAIGKGRVFPEEQFIWPLDEKKTIWIRGKIDQLFQPTIYRHTLAMDETKTKAQISFSMLDLAAQMTTYLWFMRERYGKKYKRFIAWRTIMRRQMPGPRVKARLFARESVERSDEELDQWLRDTRRKAADILDAAIYPTETDHCSFDCDFYNLCLVRSNTADLKDIIKSEYTRK